VRYAFYIGAVTILLAVGWTVLATREPPARPIDTEPTASGAVRALRSADRHVTYGSLWVGAAIGGALLAGWLREAGFGPASLPTAQTAIPSQVPAPVLLRPPWQV